MHESPRPPGTEVGQECRRGVEEAEKIRVELAQGLLRRELFEGAALRKSRVVDKIVDVSAVWVVLFLS